MSSIMFYLPAELEQKVRKEKNRAKLVQLLLTEYYKKHVPGDFKGTLD